MARRVFYSFHYAKDAFRAAKVRGIGVVEGNQPAKDNDWETVTRGGDAAITRWINEQMYGRTCTLVLVGPETAGRKWINYEIRRAWETPKMGLLGIRIHRLLDHFHQPTYAGNNPFSSFTVDNGRQSLADLVTLHDPLGTSSQDVYGHIESNLDRWIEAAIRARQ